MSTPINTRSAERPLVHRQSLGGPAWFTVGLPCLPVLLWWIAYQSPSMAGSASSLLGALGLLAGLLGFVLFAMNLVLSARFPTVERLFGALDRMYRFHRRLAAAVAGLLGAHLVLMTGSRLIVASAQAVALYLPDAGWRVFSGVLAAAGFAALLGLSTMARLRHEPFLRVHRLFGIVFIVGALHALRVPAFSALPWWVAGYLLVLTVVAVGAWVYRSGLGRTLVPRRFYEVAQVRPLHSAINEVTLTPLEEPLDFEPGQLVFIALDDEAVTRELHPFSITSARGEPQLRLVVKAIGDYTTALRAVPPGALARIEGPYGGFWHGGAAHRRQVWIAGGIGVTPFLSIVRSLGPTLGGQPEASGAEGGGPLNDYEIDFYYCTEDAEAAVFLDELFAIADEHPTLRVIPIRADSIGFLSAQDVRAASGDLGHTHIFMCGPPAMLDALTAQFVELGVQRERLHFEDFRLRGR